MRLFFRVRHAHSPRLVVASLVVFFSIVSLPPPGNAHLALVRQGDDSADMPEVGDRYGWAVVAGDFDNDGYDDLASGAPWDDVNSGHEIGNVVISPGSPFGVTHVGAYKRGLSFLNDTTVRFGHALAVGDFNNDTYDDLAVGAPYIEVGAVVDAGKVYVYYGSPTGLGLNPDQFDQSDFGILEAPETADLFGYSLAADDFNGDLHDDLAIGSIGEDNEAGAVFVLLGSGTGVTTTGSLVFRQSDFGETDTPDDWFGHDLATGNVTLDPDIDLVIGTPKHGSLSNGRVYILPSQGGNLNASWGSWFDPGTLGIPVSTDADSYFGWSVAVGRFMKATGGLSIAVGEPRFPTATFSNAGRVIVTNQHVAILAATGEPAAALPGPTEVLTQNSTPGETIFHNEYFGWSLAVGQYNGTYGDDLAVGSPGETESVNGAGRPNSGLVHVFVGTALSDVTPTFPLFAFSRRYDADGLFDRHRGQRLGHSLAFGNFDGHPERTSVAAGAPNGGFDYWINPAVLPDAGYVAIIAPWRQTMFTRARSATLLDCYDNLIFTVRPFDELQVASTTKILPVWIAADHIEWGLRDSTESITTHRWIADCFNGSSVPLTEDENVNLINLMRMAIAVSGGDACYAIADLLTGDTWGWPQGDCDASNQIPIQIPAFSDSMNARAAAVGAMNTHFNNPAGRPYKAMNGPEPHSSAYDMALIGRAAMENAIFREIVKTPTWEIIRAIHTDNGVSVVNDTIPNKWISGMNVRLGGRATGLKPGSNLPSLQTRVASATDDSTGLDVLASVHGVQITDDDDVSGSWASFVAARLCSLGIAACANFTIDAIPVEPVEREPLMKLPGIPTAQGGGRGAVFNIPEVDDEVLVEIYRQDEVTPATCVDLLVERGFTWVLDPGETNTLTVAPFDSTRGIRLENIGSKTASLQIIHNLPPATSYPLSLAPGEDSLVIAPMHSPGVNMALLVQNLSSTEAESLLVDEVGYRWEVNFDGVLGNPDFQSKSLALGTGGSYRTFSAHVLGKDSIPGNTVTLVVRKPGTTTAVVDPPGPGTARAPSALISSLRSFPNPSNPVTTVEYTLTATSSVRIDVFDVAGRFITTLENARRKAAGTYRVKWDGNDRFGQGVASGVYFYRVRAGFETRASRMVVLK